MSSVIVLDSSDEDETPAKKIVIPHLNSSTTITLIKSKEQTHPLYNIADRRISDSKVSKAAISNTLLSPTITTTIAKPKPSTLPKINAAFTSNATAKAQNSTSATPKKPTHTLPSVTTSNMQQKILQQHKKSQQSLQHQPWEQQQNKKPCQLLQQNHKQHLQQQQQQHSLQQQSKKQQPQQQKPIGQKPCQQQQKKSQQLFQQQSLQQQQKKKHLDQQSLQQQQQQQQKKKHLDQQSLQQQQQKKKHLDQQSLQQQLQQSLWHKSPSQQQQLQQDQIQQMQLLRKSGDHCYSKPILQKQRPFQQQSTQEQSVPQNSLQQQQQKKRQQEKKKQEMQKHRQNEQHRQQLEDNLHKFEKGYLQQKLLELQKDLMQKPQNKRQSLEIQAQTLQRQQNLQAQPAQLRHQPLSLQHQPQELQNRSQSLQNRSLSLQNRTQPLQRQAQSQQQYLQKQQQLQSPQQQQQKSPQQQKLQQSTQRKRKLSPSPTPIALMPATSSYNILPSMLMLNSSASMMPIIPDMHSMTPSATPPFQLLATPTSLASPPRLRPPSSLASTSSSTYSCFIQASDSYRASIPPLKNNVDNFKIRLPLKHPNNVNSTSTTTSVSTSLTTAASRATATPTNTNSTLTKPTITATTATSTTTPATSTTTPATSTTTPATSTTTPATSTPTSTASVLRGVKRIKPTTLLKKSDEAWLMRRTKPTASGTPVGLSQLEDDIMEVLPTPLPPSSSVSPKSPLTTLQELYGTGVQRGRFATTKQVSAPPVPVAISASPLSTTPPRSLTPKTVSPTKPATPAMRTRTSIEYSDKSVAPITRAPAVRMVGEKLSPNQPQPARNTKVSTDTQKKSDRTPVFDLTNSPEKPSIKRSYSLMSPPSSSSATTPGAISPPVSSASKAIRKNGTPAIIDLADIDSIKNTVDITEQKGQQAREPLSSEFEDLLRVCRTADPSDDMDNLIKKKLTRLFYETDSVFVRSICFRKQLRSTIERIEANPRLVYFNLSGILNILKARREKPVEASTQQSEKQTSEMAVEVEPTGDEHKDEEIKKLNEELRLVRKRIEQLEEAEVDFDDDDSSYLQLERWKKRACQIYEKICELTGERKNALRLVRKPIKFNGTEYPQFNRKLQAFVNQTKEFPDYTDVLRILEHCNEVHKLGLAQFEMKHIAEDAFIKVGKSLQSRRKTDLHETVTHYISNTKDPAATDPTLLAKLSENQKLKKNINEIFEKYARKQDQTAEEIRLKKAATAAANAATATVNASGDAPKSSTKYNDILTAITTADDTVAVVTEEDIAEIDDNDDEDEDEEDDDEEDGDEDEPIEIEDEAERIEISDDDDDDDYDEGGDDDGKEDDGDEDEAGGDNDSTDSETDNERDGTKNLDDVSTDENEFILDTYVTKAAIGKKVNAEESLISKTSNSEEKIIGSQLDKSSATKSPEFFNIYDSKDNSRNSYNNLSSASSNNFIKRRSSNSNNNNNNNLSSNKNQEFSSLTKKRRPSLCLKKFASMKTAINNKKQSKETVTNGTRTTTKRANSPPPSIPPPPPSLPPPSSSIPPSPSSSIPPPPPSIPPPTTTIGMTPATTLKITSVSSLNESVNKITSNGNLSNRCTYSPQATKSHTFAEIVISDEET